MLFFSQLSELLARAKPERYEIMTPDLKIEVSNVEGFVRVMRMVKANGFATMIVNHGFEHNPSYVSRLDYVSDNGGFNGLDEFDVAIGFSPDQFVSVSVWLGNS